MSTIEIKNMTKRYGEAEVLSNINMKDLWAEMVPERLCL